MAGPAAAGLAGTVIEGSAMGLSRSLTHSSSALSKSLGVFNELQPALSTGLSAGSGAASSMSSSLTQVGSLILQVNDKYEQSLRAIKVGSGKTGNELNELIQSHKAIIKQVPTDAVDAANVMIDVNTRTGAEGVALEQLTTQVLKAARITNKLPIEVSSSLTGVMSTMNMKPEQGAEVVDKALAISQAKGLDNDLFGQRMSVLAPKMDKMGIGFDESADLIGNWHLKSKNFEKLNSAINMVYDNMTQAGVKNYDSAFKDLREKIKNASTFEEASKLAMKSFSSQIGYVPTTAQNQVMTEMVIAIREGLLDTKDDINESKSAYLQDSKGLVNKNYQESITFEDKVGMMGNQILSEFGPVAKQLTGLFEKAFPDIKQAASDLAKVISDNMPAIRRIFSFMSSLLGVILKITVGLIDFFIKFTDIFIILSTFFLDPKLLINPIYGFLKIPSFIKNTLPRLSGKETKESNKSLSLFDQNNALPETPLHYNSAPITSDVSNKVPNIWLNLDTATLMSKDFRSSLKVDQAVPTMPFNNLTNKEFSMLPMQKEATGAFSFFKNMNSIFEEIKSISQNVKNNPVESPTKIAGAAPSTNYGFTYTQASGNNPAYNPSSYPMMPPAPYYNNLASSSNPAHTEISPVINVTVNGDSYESTAKDIADKVKLAIQDVFESASRRQGIAVV